MKLIEDDLIKKNYEFEIIKKENIKILQSISLIHDCFLVMEEDFNNINTINTKLSNGFEIWIQQQKEIFRNAKETKNNKITFNDCFISESIKNDIEKLSENFPKIMNIKKIKSDNNLQTFLNKIIIKQKENSISKKEKNINDLNEFNMNIQIGNLKEKKVEINDLNQINNETIISLGTIMEQPSREEKDNNYFKSFGNINQNNNEVKSNELVLKDNESKKINNAFEIMKKSIEKKNLKKTKQIDNIKVNNTLKTFVNETQIYKQKLENYKISKTISSNKLKNENKIKDQILSEDVNKIKEKIYNSINPQNELLIIKNNNNSEKNIQTPSFANIKPLNYSNNKIPNNNINKQEFTFSKIIKNNNLQKPQKTTEKSKNSKINKLNNFIESSPMIEEWKNPLRISTNNNLFNNLQFSQNSKTKNNFNNDNFERDYSITDISSNDSFNDEINSNKFIPEWAKDEKYIEEQIKKQNENENYCKEIFGKFIIEKLNLNMIFETMNEKYNLRNSTADWKFDISNKNNNNVINYQHLNENSNFFPQTNRQLHFSGLKN